MSQYVGFKSRLQIEWIKDHLRGRTDVSEHILNCDYCKNERHSVNNFNIKIKTK